MKQVKSFLKIFSLGLLLVGGAACTGNFDEINRKEYEVTKDEQGRENYNIGSTLRGLQGLVVPTKEHLYQFIEALAAGPFAGYYGTTLVRTDKFETYNPSVDWQDKTYGDIFTESYPLYRDLQDQSDDPVALALAKLLRVAIMHRMTDMYGPIPYSKVIDEQGSVSLNVPYDSQEAVYKQMLKELDEVSSVLKENLTIGSEAFRKFDDVYYGDVSKWYKFANSLKLRMAIRMVYVDPTTAQQVAQDDADAGVITDNADNAEMKVEENRAAMVFNGWSDHRMGADLLCYMNGYQDPRREKMFTQVEITETVGGKPTKVSGFAGIRIGIDVVNKESVIDRYSKPIISTASPYPWMNAAEVTFLRAEGALRGWAMGGDAKSLYEEAIALSFEQYGLPATDALSYAANASNTPQAYTDPVDGTYSAGAVSNLTVAWQEGDEYAEKNLERIITQKWIAMFPSTVEAWSEYRRTDYPHLLPVVVNNSGGTIDDTKAKIRRLWYPPSEYSGNRQYILEAVGMLGGPDNGATSLWWDKKPRP